MTQQPHAHLTRPHKEPPAHAPNAALMIDFDNVTMGIRSDLQTELKRLLQSDIIRGKVAVQRAYADWRRYPQYVVPLAESSIDLIWAPAYGSNKKNATDIRLAVDALELVFTRPEIGTFILLSGDSDFSSLVLKLKEYGKYVIGVGIRESSSDLLIQNCDEYYSYNELAGLTKETDVAHERHDPWQLVVEAVKQMTAHNDVMRSDRLKQVMQEIDPTFTEKDLGFSRFSKFVVEAAHKGLLNLTKLDNGQYEIGLGAGVPGAAAQPSTLRGATPHEERDRAPRGARPPRAPRPPRPPRLPGPPRPPAAEPQSDEVDSRRGSRFSLGETFGLLRQALSRLGGSDKPVSADELREAMIELEGGQAEPLEADRFPKLLRQAHDAEIIDLSKDGDGAYAVRLREEPRAPVAPEPEPVGAGDLDEANDPPMPASSAPPSLWPAPHAPAPSQAGGGVPPRSARFRRGSRGPRTAPPEIPKIGVVEVDPNFKPRIELIPTRPAVTESGGTDAPPAPSAPLEDGRRQRSGGGRGGRARRGDSGDVGEGAVRRERDHGDRGEQSERGGRGEGGERGERSGRSRRGGRGRGGRGRAGVEERYAEERPSAPQDAAALTPPTPEPPAGKAEKHADEQEGGGGASGGGSEGESFWTKVKRGLTGGA